MEVDQLWGRVREADQSDASLNELGILKKRIEWVSTLDNNMLRGGARRWGFHRMTAGIQWFA